jgi:hypothetical protein
VCNFVPSDFIRLWDLRFSGLRWRYFSGFWRRVVDQSVVASVSEKRIVSNCRVEDRMFLLLSSRLKMETLLDYLGSTGHGQKWIYDCNNNFHIKFGTATDRIILSLVSRVYFFIFLSDFALFWNIFEKGLLDLKAFPCVKTPHFFLLVPRLLYIPLCNE